MGCHGETLPGVPSLVKSLRRSGVRARRSREHSLGGGHCVHELACPSAGGTHGLQSTWHALQHPLVEDGGWWQKGTGALTLRMLCTRCVGLGGRGEAHHGAGDAGDAQVELLSVCGQDKVGHVESAQCVLHDTQHLPVD